jgi:RNA exonuclease 1
MPIIDCKTKIHGISEEQLKTAQFSLRHAQAFLRNICSQKTIIVGHAVHNDLKALKFDHDNVIDTAYLYSLVGEPSASASIRDISDQVLGVKLPDIHDSVLDARAALQAAVHAMTHEDIPLIVRSSPFSACLLIHRIPSHLSMDQIKELFISQTQVVPISIDLLPEKGTNADPSFKCNAIFLTQQHADLAFETINGPLKADKSQRPQKRIYLSTGSYIYIRKY